ncbi:hypothetical protein, partial [Achromobacter xylosoxidans]|uniref:hypothetical protein n=1 Tax=Alcaligenes xylosoxydans xylosoxydans TaxID=85698 RepID=UPI001F139F11
LVTNTRKLASFIFKCPGKPSIRRRPDCLSLRAVVISTFPASHNEIICHWLAALATYRLNDAHGLTPYKAAPFSHALIQVFIFGLFKRRQRQTRDHQA